jgi:hypothetical protein
VLLRSKFKVLADYAKVRSKGNLNIIVDNTISFMTCIVILFEESAGLREPQHEDNYLKCVI